MIANILLHRDVQPCKSTSFARYSCQRKVLLLYLFCENKYVKELFLWLTARSSTWQFFYVKSFLYTSFCLLVRYSAKEFAGNFRFLSNILLQMLSPSFSVIKPFLKASNKICPVSICFKLYFSI